MAGAAQPDREYSLRFWLTGSNSSAPAQSLNGPARYASDVEVVEMSAPTVPEEPQDDSFDADLCWQVLREAESVLAGLEVVAHMSGDGPVGW